ncbi:sensor histidine kinase [Leptospira ognonensis]|uniref:histidine kinase n=1 Tax=Leptospira ognonensis TaxID=2484945 RepID=A0A4R9K902_9LEPT|nr:ABC transporter substrate-binding protein [Leptospira ognonensis]TGL62152.1 sensor histidine kinase [Leptospira ognonensis]
MLKVSYTLRSKFFSSLVAYSVTLFLCSGGDLFATDKIELYLKWTHQFQFAGYYAALEKGYYKDVGLDVDIIESRKGVEGLHQQVTAEAGRYGVGTNEVLLQWHAGTPIVVIAVIFQHSPSVLYLRKISSTQSIHDIAGKKVMLSPRVYEILAYLKKEGIKSSDFIQLEHSFKFEELGNGKVDALDGYSTSQTYDLEKAKVPFLTFSPRMAGIDFYGDNLFTSQFELESNPERVKNFREASLRGWQYAMNHKEEIADLILSKYNGSLSKERLLYEAEQMVPLIQPILVEIGYMNPGRWKHIADIYSEFGMLPKNLDLDSFIYNPNPQPNYTIIIRSVAALCILVVLVWILLRQRWNRRYSENLEKEVAQRTDELREINQSLKTTLNDLTEAQGRLINSEKLATIGKLAAGMAHELNTPLGAIVSSNHSIATFLKADLRVMIESLSKFEENDFRLLEVLLKESLRDESHFIDGKQERALKKELASKFSDALKMNISGEHIALVIESGAYRLEEEKVRSILESKKSIELLQLAKFIANANRSCSIISVATEKATHVVKALKNYLVSDQDSKSGESQIDVVHEIENILYLYYYNIHNQVTISKNFTTSRKCLGNRDSLNQVWVNLINNSLHAMSNEGSIEIKVEDEADFIKVTFIDSGVGIPESIQPKIFDPFFTSKTDAAGLGLGLDICKKIILNLRGRIEFESKPGRTAFYVYLPAFSPSSEPSNH